MMHGKNNTSLDFTSASTRRAHNSIDFNLPFQKGIKQQFLMHSKYSDLVRNTRTRINPDGIKYPKILISQPTISHMEHIETLDSNADNHRRVKFPSLSKANISKLNNSQDSTIKEDSLIKLPTKGKIIGDNRFKTIQLRLNTKSKYYEDQQLNDMANKLKDELQAKDALYNKILRNSIQFKMNYLMEKPHDCLFGHKYIQRLDIEDTINSKRFGFPRYRDQALMNKIIRSNFNLLRSNNQPSNESNK